MTKLTEIDVLKRNLASVLATRPELHRAIDTFVERPRRTRQDIADLGLIIELAVASPERVCAVVNCRCAERLAA